MNNLRIFFTLIIIAACAFIFTSKYAKADSFFKSVEEVGYYEEINSRGHPTEGRNKVDYKNIIGYVAISKDEFLTDSEKFPKQPWKIKTYKKDKQFFIEDKQSIEHKTEVLCLEDLSEYDNRCRLYKGYIKIKKLSDGKEFYIDIHNFVTKPYWKYPVEESVKNGPTIAIFKQKSDYYPENKGEKVELKDGFKVLVIGYNSYKNTIGAIVYKKWRYGFGGVEVQFKPDDLTNEY